MVLGWFPCGWSDGWRVGLGVVRWGWDGHASVGHNRAEEPPPPSHHAKKKGKSDIAAIRRQRFDNVILVKDVLICLWLQI